MAWTVAVLCLTCAGIGWAGEREDVLRHDQAYTDAVQRLFDTGDLGPIMDVFAENAVRITPNGTQRGREAIRDGYARTAQRVKNGKLTTKRVIVEGRTVVAVVSNTFVSGKTGKPVEFEFVRINEYDAEGKVTSFTMYFDTASVRKQIDG
jgi:ketosteroid isomerase-like protein